MLLTSVPAQLSLVPYLIHLAISLLFSCIYRQSLALNYYGGIRGMCYYSFFRCTDLLVTWRLIWSNTKRVRLGDAKTRILNGAIGGWGWPEVLTNHTLAFSTSLSCWFSIWTYAPSVKKFLAANDMSANCLVASTFLLYCTPQIIVTRTTLDNHPPSVFFPTYLIDVA